MKLSTIYLLLVFCCSVTFIYSLDDSSSDAFPFWPTQWVTDWTIIYTSSDQEPPFSNNNIPPPFKGGSGRTYYDWSNQAMHEVYNDFCVPIFSNGSDWTCDFINVKGVSYLVTHDDRPADVPPCCIFGDPWYPPAPNFIQTCGAVQNVTSSLNGQQVDYWTIYLPDSGSFGYGFYANGTSNGWTPASFYFAAAPSGWTIQNFENFQPTTPPANAFQVPDSCINASPCPPQG
ncbi:hypothetical protein PPL_10029 [Heterostelium album PN500]|uniref:Uncharacterized protein n=1 Tax=Heterostelium pallidum (strain ATCC 26659 / Pp 5 / PN500) TaxID=670386 RepID=D3BQ48_HETP5|nr:hypothetical protein PPL_10029 [Heterostelium album PN500]EFA76268.1 hypothetical protein PPL_10029 [Heterostelium album PN500]|eukprot:XP_020428400.1 hypothetical protein PPL_10029 [Heterostelium album PN500]